VDIDWKATANIWAKVTTDLLIGDSPRGLFQLQTGSAKLKNLKVEFDGEQGDPKSTFNYSVDFNEHHLDYKSYTILKPQSLEGWSELNTNIELFGKGKRVTNYRIQFSQDLSVPFALVYKVEQEGTVITDIDASIDIQLTKGFDLKIHFDFPAVLPEPFDLKASLEAEVAGPQKSAKFTASYVSGAKKYNFLLEGKLSDKELAFLMKSNVGGISEFKAKVGWQTEQNKTKINFLSMLNGAKFLQGSIAFDKDPFSRLVITVQREEANRQEIELRLYVHKNLKLNFH
jgi:hypothetical protein